MIRFAALACALALVAPSTAGAATPAPAVGEAASCGTIPCQLASLGPAPCDFACVRDRAASDPAARFWLGAAYANGTGTAKDLDAAFDAWYSAARDGNMQAGEALGELSEHRARYDLAAEAYKGARDGGNFAAAYYLSALYGAHLAVPDELRKPGAGAGVELHGASDPAYEKAQFNTAADSANGGFGPAFVRLALLFAEGLGTAKDCGAASRWYERARVEKSLSGTPHDRMRIKSACPTVATAT